jgi:hypothetical protein
VERTDKSESPHRLSRSVGSVGSNQSRLYCGDANQSSRRYAVFGPSQHSTVLCTLLAPVGLWCRTVTAAPDRSAARDPNGRGVDRLPQQGVPGDSHGTCGTASLKVAQRRVTPHRIASHASAQVWPKRSLPLHASSSDTAADCIGLSAERERADSLCFRPAQCAHSVENVTPHRRIRVHSRRSSRPHPNG